MEVTRREFLHYSAASLAFVGLATGGARQQQPKPPNFVIILLDDSGWADFRSFSKTVYQTPNVELLAKQGCSFHNF